METLCVFFEVETDTSNIIHMSFSLQIDITFKIRCKLVIKATTGEQKKIVVVLNYCKPNSQLF